MSEPVALITGAARRIGATIAETLHSEGYRVVIHCRRSRNDADMLAMQLNGHREQSADVVSGDLLVQDELEQIARDTLQAFGRLDLLVNNASSFHPTEIGSTSREQWNDLVGSNFQAPYFLVQALLPALRESRGSIVNLLDIHAEIPMPGHAVYSAAKAGLHMLTRAMAKELAPDVRVNGVAPGAILWPESGSSVTEREKIVADTPMKRTGTPEDIANAVMFLAGSGFITGQIIAVDGGRSL
ncbi:MAG: pteridine reductase [Proteobacteria bacterium]|nr:pteridine reductase [Pseudomonadota bacterium]